MSLLNRRFDDLDFFDAYFDFSWDSPAAPALPVDGLSGAGDITPGANVAELAWDDFFPDALPLTIPAVPDFQNNPFEQHEAASRHDRVIADAAAALAGDPVALVAEPHMAGFVEQIGIPRLFLEDFLT